MMRQCVGTTPRYLKREHRRWISTRVLKVDYATLGQKRDP